MAKLTLEEVKNNLRLDHDYDDAYLSGLISASDYFIIGAVGTISDEKLDVPEDETRFETLQYMLVSLWYENRVPATSALQQQVPFTISAMIHQLRGDAIPDAVDTDATT